MSLTASQFLVNTASKFNLRNQRQIIKIFLGHAPRQPGKCILHMLSVIYKLYKSGQRMIYERPNVIPKLVASLDLFLNQCLYFVWLLCYGEKCVFLLHAWKPGLLKSSHMYHYLIWHHSLATGN